MLPIETQLHFPCKLGRPNCVTCPPTLAVQAQELLESERGRSQEEVSRLEAGASALRSQLANADARVTALEHSATDLQSRLADARAAGAASQESLQDERERARLAGDRVWAQWEGAAHVRVR